MLNLSAFSILLLGLVVVGLAGAQAQAPPPHLRPAPKAAGAEVVAVNACVRHVRQLLPAERLDAHVGLDGQIRSTGNDAAIGRFKQCLQQAGHPME